MSIGFKNRNANFILRQTYVHFLFTVSLFPLLAEVIEDLLSPSYNSGGLIGGVTQQPPIHLNKMPTLLKVTLMKKIAYI